MLDKDIIGKMSSAGVPAELIIKMLLSEDAENPGPASHSVVGPSPEIPAPEAPAQPDPAPSAPAGSPAVGEKPSLSIAIEPEPDPVLTAIRELTGAIQASNIINKSRDYVAPKSLQDQTDDILAKILTGEK